MNGEMKTGKNIKSSKIIIYAVAALVFTFAAIILRTLSMLFEYDTKIGYYKSGAALPIIFKIVCTLGVATFLSAFLLLRKEKNVGTGKESNIVIKCASAVAAFGFAGYIVLTLTGGVTLTAKIIILLISAILSIVYFLMNFRKNFANRDAQMLTGIGILAFTVCSLAISYFDMYVQMNSPNKMMLHLACLSTLVFFVNEYRALVSVRRNGFYIFSICTAVLFIGTSSIPSIIASNAGVIADYHYVNIDYVFLGIFVYCLARLVTLAFMAETPKTSPQETVNVTENSVAEDMSESAPKTENTENEKV